MTDRRDHLKKDEDFQYHLFYMPHSIERLEKLGTKSIYEANTTLFSAGNIPDFCFVVRAGSVIAYEYTYNGDRRVYNIIEPGAIILEECCLLDKPCPVSFQALTKCELIRIEKCDLKHAFKHDIDIVMDICASLATKFLSTMEYQRYDPRQSSEWKICRLLLMFIDHYGVIQKDGSVLLERKLSHQMIADILTMNRVTVSRQMKAFRDLGICESINGYLHFPDRESIAGHMNSLASN